LKDAISTRALELVLPVSTRQESDSQSASASCGKHVPDAIPHNSGGPDLDSQALCGGDEQIWIGLSILYLITGYDGHE
jgi:hypothetical protein